MNPATLSRLLHLGKSPTVQNSLRSVLKRSLTTANGPCKAQFKEAWVDPDDRMVCLKSSSDDRVLKYPGVWIRDNCQCPDCFYSVSNQRQILMRDFDPEVAPSTVQLENEHVAVQWGDGHKSVLHEDWLLKREFTGDEYSERKLLSKGPNKQLWGAENELKRHNFTDILNDDHKLFEWLKDIQVFGIAVVENMPNVFGSLQVLRDRVGCRRLTHYGDGFHVCTKPNANDLAYTGRGLGLHTDHPYYEYSPGVQFLHCMRADNLGGENEFADAFKVAEIMRQDHYQEWTLLAQTKVEFQNIGADAFGDFNKAKVSPIFQYDESGNLHTVRFSNQARGSYLTTLTPEKVLPFYRALKLFNDLCYHKDQMVIHRLNPGECVVFDNLRVLHGRKDFTVTAGGTRQLHGGYMDWDEIRSKFNSLYKKLEHGCCN